MAERGMRKLRTMFIGLLLMVFVAASCGGGDDGMINIAVVPKGLTHEFWKSIHAGALEAEKELRSQGVQVSIDWQGPNKESDREQQIKIVENQIGMGTDAIVLAPLDAQALVRPVLEANKNGRPVVVIDSGLEIGEDKYISFIATNNFEGGRKGGGRIADLVEVRQQYDRAFKPGIILLRYELGHASTDARERGFLDMMEKRGLTDAILSSNQYAGATRESGQMKAEALLNQYRGRVNAIFCPNESSVYGTLQALRRTGLLGKVYVVGFDATPALVEALRVGELHGLILQDPVRMGYLGVRFAVDALAGKPLEKRIDTGAWVATPDNMDDPEIALRLNPDLSILDEQR